LKSKVTDEFDIFAVSIGLMPWETSGLVVSERTLHPTTIRFPIGSSVEFTLKVVW
jgi:hypothetical protein